MRMVEAYARSAQGDEAQARVLLARALACGRDDRTSQSFRWLVVGFRRMLALALRTGTEPEHARDLIARFAIAAESPDVDPWPWPIRIRTLGGFSVSVEGVAPAAGRKAQKKPLDMLKYVIAQGGREVSAAALEAALWPQAESSAEAFEVTLRRLRKLLANDEALSLVDGKLALNAGICWLDTWAFERAQSNAESLLNRRASRPDAASVAALCERALELYPGHFLAGDDDKPWLLGARQRLASKYQRLVIAAGLHWEEQGASARAERAYVAALELDPLAEPIYRRLMTLQTKAGRRAEALETYRRCRHMLSVVLGLAPSAETEAARRSLLESA
jgi:LuxR family maltose regulon positive regulatory protein